MLTFPIYSRVTLELGLPRIVVVGSQSVGKSSLIENISGVCLELIDPKFVSYFVIDNHPSRQLDMHQVTDHYLHERSAILMGILEPQSNVIRLPPHPHGGRSSAFATSSIAKGKASIGQR